MKKALSVVLAVCIIGVFMMFAVGSGESGQSGQTNEQGSGTVEQANTENANKLGKYQLDILSCRLAKDFEGKDVVIVKYNYTNVDNDNPTSFMVAFEDNVYQNDIGLNKAFILGDSANYSSDNQTKDIKKGASIEVEVAYELNDTTSDVIVEVGELISFSDDIVTKTFSLS